MDPEDTGCVFALVNIFHVCVRLSTLDCFRCRRTLDRGGATRGPKVRACGHPSRRRASARLLRMRSEIPSQHLRRRS